MGLLKDARACWESFALIHGESVDKYLDWGIQILSVAIKLRVRGMTVVSFLIGKELREECISYFDSKIVTMAFA